MHIYHGKPNEAQSSRIMYLEYGHIEHEAFRNDLGCVAILMAVLKYDRLICIANFTTSNNFTTNAV